MNLGLLILACATLFIFADNAYAYIDLGTGSYVIQIILAFLVTGLYFVKRQWNRIVEFFKRNRNKQS